MKTFFLLCCTLVFAMGPIDGMAQDAEIVISNDQTLMVKQVFKLIHKQTNYRFIYRLNTNSDQDLEVLPSINLKNLMML